VTGGLGLIDDLLRDRRGVVARIDAGRDLTALVRTCVATVAVGGALFGAALGAFRGGVQIAYAALKLPVVLLATAALSAPTLTAVGRALGRPAGLARDLALVVAALATGTVVLVALAPVVLAARAVELGYHHSILLACACMTAAGLVSVAVVVRGVRSAAARDVATTVAALVAVFALVGGQVAWTLRPYLVRPRAPAAPLVRSLEGSLYEAVIDTVSSARGRYRRAFAPLPEDSSWP